MRRRYTVASGQGAGRPTPGSPRVLGLYRECVQVLSTPSYVLKDPGDPGESLVGVVTRARQHDASSILRSFGRADFVPVRV
jgi:hypothetical protein